MQSLSDKLGAGVFMASIEVAHGLEDLVVTQSSICSIENDELRYRGYIIDELAEKASFEEVVYLLWHGELPNAQQLKLFRDELNQVPALPQEVVQFLKGLPLESNPMDVLRTTISLIGAYDTNKDQSPDANFKRAQKLLVWVSSVVAAWDRVRNKKEIVKAPAQYSLAEKFIHELTGNKPFELSAKAFNMGLVLHADHELNASTFAARVTVATLTDIYSGVTSAIGTLKGPLHGGANTAVMQMLEKIGSLKKVEAFIENAFANKEKIPGFGHRVYKDGDPRAKHLKNLSQQLCEKTGNSEYFDMSVKIAEIVKAKKGLLPNVDFYSATVYHSMGIAKDLFTPIFAVSRISGWTAHILEQYQNNRLIRPRADYSGPKARRFIPVEQR